MRPERPLFVTIHGIDGTGKTTTSDTLSTQLITHGIKTINYDVYEAENIDNPFSASKKRVVAETSPDSQLAFYLGSTMYHSDKIDDLLHQGYSVVKSRYIDDVLAHHAQLGVKYVTEIANLFPMVQPDLRVILTLNEEARRERIRQRGERDLKDKEVRQKGSRLDFFENYLLEKSTNLMRIGRAMRIDTSQINPEQVAQQIIDHLLNLQLLNQEQE